MSEVLRGDVGVYSKHLITTMRDEAGRVAVGNVVRRACDWIQEHKLNDDETCLKDCQLKARFKEQPDNTDLYVDFIDRTGKCADQNLSYAFDKAGLLGANVLMVGVTENGVGIADKLDEYDVVEKPDWNNMDNDQNGWKELPGFNAFFARKGELDALGRRLADCADINFEFEDSEGVPVIGFEHGTRKNMFGSKDYEFEREGRKVTFTEYALGLAIDHYGVNPSTIRIKLAAAIEGPNFEKHFDSVQAMEEHISGWFHDGYVWNMDNPNWQPGPNGELTKSEAWAAESRAMIISDIQSAMEEFGIPEDNFSTEGIIDPAADGSLHSSHERREEFGDTRDLYLTYFT